MSFEFIASSKGFVTMITSEPLFRMECTDMFPYQGVFREFLQKNSIRTRLSGLFWGKTCSKKVKALFSKVQWSVKRLDLLEKPLLEGVIIYWKKRYFLWWSSSWEITRYLYKKCCHVKPVLLPEVETNILFRQKTSLNTCQYFVVFPS